MPLALLRYLVISKHVDVDFQIREMRHHHLCLFSYYTIMSCIGDLANCAQFSKRGKINIEACMLLYEMVYKDRATNPKETWDEGVDH